MLFHNISILIDTQTKEILHIGDGYYDNLGKDLEKIIYNYLNK